MSNVLREGVRLFVDLVMTTFFFLESVEDRLTNVLNHGNISVQKVLQIFNLLSYDGESLRLE